MMFTINDQLVKGLIKLIDSGEKTIDDIPDVYNLKELIIEWYQG